MAKFKNVEFVQADILKTESYPPLDNVDAVVHSVGTITDLINYKKYINDPAALARDPMGLF